MYRFREKDMSKSSNDSILDTPTVIDIIILRVGVVKGSIVIRQPTASDQEQIAWGRLWRQYGARGTQTNNICVAHHIHMTPHKPQSNALQVGDQRLSYSSGATECISNQGS